MEDLLRKLCDAIKDSPCSARHRELVKKAEETIAKLKQGSKPRAVIYLDGGLVQWVAHNIPDLIIDTLDGDTDGADEGELTLIKFNDGPSDVFLGSQEEGMYDPEYTKELSLQIDMYFER